MNLYRAFGKRLLDLVIAVPAVIVGSPIIVIVAVLVRIKLGSPVIFSQVRPGPEREAVHDLQVPLDARRVHGGRAPADPDRAADEVRPAHPVHEPR